MKDWKHLQRQGVYVSNFERTKGLEFQVVFLPQLQKLTTQLAAAHLTPTEQCRRLFTAMTRARHTLTLTTCGPLPTFCEALTAVVDDL